MIKLVDPIWGFDGSDCARIPLPVFLLMPNFRNRSIESVAFAPDDNPVRVHATEEDFVDTADVVDYYAQERRSQRLQAGFQWKLPGYDRTVDLRDYQVSLHRVTPLHDSWTKRQHW